MKNYVVERIVCTMYLQGVRDFGTPLSMQSVERSSCSKSSSHLSLKVEETLIFISVLLFLRKNSYVYQVGRLYLRINEIRACNKFLFTI